MSDTESQTREPVEESAEDVATEGGGPSRRPRLMLALPLVAIVAIIAGATALLLNVNSKPALPGNARAESVTGFEGQALSPRLPAPSFGRLHNYNGGGPVDLADYRGRAVFATFLYTKCPDVCPLKPPSCTTPWTCSARKEPSNSRSSPFRSTQRATPRRRWRPSSGRIR